MHKIIIFIGLWLCIASGASHAHSSAIASYEIEQHKAGDWTLTISVPLGGLHLALLNTYDEEALWVKEGEYNVALVVQYLKKHSQILANQKTPLTLLEVNAELDDHQSQFIFSIENMPQPLHQLTLHFDAMSENPGHINIARVKQASYQNRVILSYANDFRGVLAFKR